MLRWIFVTFRDVVSIMCPWICCILPETSSVKFLINKSNLQNYSCQIFVTLFPLLVARTSCVILFLWSDCGHCRRGGRQPAAARWLLSGLVSEDSPVWKHFVCRDLICTCVKSFYMCRKKIVDVLLRLVSICVKKKISNSEVSLNLSNQIQLNCTIWDGID